VAARAASLATDRHRPLSPEGAPSSARPAPRSPSRLRAAAGSRC
jgi:hypothetical protein